MLSRLARQRAEAPAALLRPGILSSTARSTAEAPTTARPLQRQQQRTLIAPPKPGDGPLMERRPDRELPNVEATRFRWSRTLPLFAAVIAAASVAIFNYQKLSSPVVGATLYALRTSDKARAHLGDEIYFAQQIPWIGGEMNQLHGRIDIRFRVKGTKGTGVMRFVSYRASPRAMFETTEWSLETEDGKVIDLLEDGDPFRGIAGGGAGLVLDDDDEEEKNTTRGFRQMRK
ncbi:hypothetical protein VTK26DRAFT_3054 [Humicola hyalothermophila]